MNRFIMSLRVKHGANAAIAVTRLSAQVDQFCLDNRLVVETWKGLPKASDKYADIYAMEITAAQQT